MDGNNIFLNNIKGIYNSILKYNIDWVIVNTGEEGSGKSTTSLWILKILNQLDLKEHIAFTFEQYVKLSRKHAYERGHVIILDEAGSSFFSREAAKKFNKLLVKWLMFNRSYYQLHILNIPNFYYIDRYIREQRVKTLLFHVFDIKKGERYGAFYTRKHVVDLINPKKHILYRSWMLKGIEFINKFRPSFVYKTPFEEIKEVWEEYEKLKKEFQSEYYYEVNWELLKKVKDEDSKKFIQKIKQDPKLKEAFNILYLLYELENMTWNSLRYLKEERYSMLRDLLKVREAVKLLERIGVIKVEPSADIKIKIKDPIVFAIFEVIEKENEKILDNLVKKNWEEL